MSLHLLIFRVLRKVKQGFGLAMDFGFSGTVMHEWERLDKIWPHLVYGHLGLGNASVSGVAAARAPCCKCSPQLSGLAF